MGKSVDIIVIGGGINGVEIARQASAAGKSVVVFEQKEIGNGASSNSSKLAHGGLRYLESFEFTLVKESLQQRNQLLSQYPDFVTPLRFIYPVYKVDARPLWQIKLGLHVYDFLAKGGPMPKHKSLSLEDICFALPGLKTDGLKGGCSYYDAKMDDLGLLKHIAMSATSQGASIRENERVVGFLNEGDAVVGVRTQRNGSKSIHEMRAKTIINVTGAWSNSTLSWDEAGPQQRVYPSKGA
jgi:glycerol-3-phosphate dehydrogenase